METWQALEEARGRGRRPCRANAVSEVCPIFPVSLHHRAWEIATRDRGSGRLARENKGTENRTFSLCLRDPRATRAVRVLDEPLRDPGFPLEPQPVPDAGSRVPTRTL